MNIDDLQVTNAVAVRTPAEVKTSVLKKLGNVYDQHAKLVFLFDVSGSMSEHIASGLADHYKWTDAAMVEARRLAEKVAAKVNLCPTAKLDLEEAKALDLLDKELGPNGERTFSPKDDAELQERVVTADLMAELKVEADLSPKQMRETRLGLVRELAKSEIEARFQKYPQARVAVIPFGDEPVVLFDEGEQSELMERLADLSIGYKGAGIMTNILKAIGAGMQVCREKPSPVGIHHFVVVSDGQDHGTYKLPGWLPTLKASGVIIDYIHIGEDVMNAHLKQVCDETGGEYVCVKTARQLRAKFLAAVNRLMLPPAPSKE